MTASIVQASCAVDVVVCDDTGTMLTPMWIPLGVAVVVLVLVAIVLVVAERRRR